MALKVLHPELAATLGPERFRREITIAAKLQHPHILSVHDSGETPTGQLWFTMMYVEGESLRDRLRREHQLPVEETIRITRETALALHYAHEHGIVHRDIKPENTAPHDGWEYAGRRLRDRTRAGCVSVRSAARTLTVTGMVVGTPQYMSPEQAAGERDVGPRSDVVQPRGGDVRDVDGGAAVHGADAASGGGQDNERAAALGASDASQRAGGAWTR